jgi:hypothetical protein
MEAAVHTEGLREAGENPARARRCNWGRTADLCHWLLSKRSWEGLQVRVIQKSEDRPLLWLYDSSVRECRAKRKNVC